MSADTDPLAAHLERTALPSDAIEGERLRNLVKARLLDQTVAETRIDRFVVLGPLGAGGMGIVYAAYDPELDRKVAIKLVRTWGDERRKEDQERLAREARSLARLSHPNVVAVYEVGLHRDSVFIAMEFVRGKTLRQHIVAGQTPWRTTVRAYLQAAEGLAAAHEAGLVHRDFKPDNAILGEDGRLRVVDFGLARGEGPQEAGARLAKATIGDDTPLTVTGALVGTPAYMAPEQRLGLPVRPKSDQFSFCAALHEAVSGTPPKMGVDGIALALPSSLPARLRRTIARGLAEQPDDRFADMRALAAELRATTETARRVRITAIIAATVGVGAGAAIPMMLGGDEACPDFAAELADVWDEPRRTALQSAAAELGEVASASAVVVERELDAVARSWTAARADACEARYVRRTDSDASFGTRMRCLDRRRQALTDLVELLGHADPGTWEHAVEAVVGLPPVAACADVESLLSEAPVPVDPEAAAEVARLRAQIDHIETLERLGRFRDAEPLAEATVRDALVVAHRPTEAEAFRARALVYGAQKRDVEAAPLLAEAAWRAEAGHADPLAVDVLARAVAGAAVRGRFEEAEAFAARLQGVLERTGRPMPNEGQPLRARYRLAFEQDRLDEAEALARAGLAASVRSGGERSLEVARDLNSLGAVQYARGDFADARESLTTSLAINREWLGASHPDVLFARTNLASVDEREGRTDEAERALESVIEDAETALVPSPVLAIALGNLANLLQNAERYGEALPVAERSIAVFEASAGPDDARMLEALNSLGLVYDGLKRPADARACYERMLAIAHRIDPDHVKKVYAWNNLSHLHTASGDLGSARELSRQALDLSLRKYGPEHATSGQLAYSLALVELKLDHLEAAQTHARHAIRVLAQRGIADAPSLAGARFVLAQALWPDPTDRAEARAAAELAMQGCETLGMQADAAEIRTWRKAHTTQ